MKRTANSSFRNEVGVICMKNKNKTSPLGLTSRNKVMLMMTPPLLRFFFGVIPFTFLLPHAVYSLQSAVCSLRSAVCGLRSAVCSLRSAVCSLQMSDTAKICFSCQVMAHTFRRYHPLDTVTRLKWTTYLYMYPYDAVVYLIRHLH